VKLIPTQFVKPFVKSNKNDFLDAEAIAEAVDRQNMRFVPIKTNDQLDLQALHRVRDRLITRRTSVINQQVVGLNLEVEQIASSDATCLRLGQIPGIGPLIATAIVASIGNGAAFHKGREFAAWMGLVPKQYSTGGKARLFGISKRGNRYLRKILIHGARAVVLRCKRDRAPMGPWITALEARAPRNVLIVATANKLARIAWAVLSTGEDYRGSPASMAA